MALLEVTGISKNFGSTHVLQNISLNLEKGEALAIIGSSGSGKTTLLRCLNFLETPDTGVIRVDGKTLWDAADPATHREVLEMAQGYAMANHFTPAGLDFSPIKGPEGNIEFLMYVQHCENPQPLPESLIEQTVAKAHETLDKAPNLH